MIAACRWLLPLLLLGGSAADASPSCPAPLQREQKKKELTPEERAKLIDRDIRVARTGSAFIKPQAIRNLIRAGEPAADRLLELTEGKKSADLALFGPSLVEAFGQFESRPGLRAKLWPLLEDPDFPWRPAAARGLAWAPVAEESERLGAFLDDPIGPVRTAILDGLFRVSRILEADVKLALDSGREGDDVEALEVRAEEAERRFLEAAVRQLSDTEDRVRRRAAILLHSLGHARALRWLVEDLKRVDSFFDLPTGLSARYEALGYLADLGVDVDGSDPEDEESEPWNPEGPMNPEGDEASAANAAAFARVVASVEALIETSEETLGADERDLVPAVVPPIARASAAPITNAVIGLELKSCRRGDFFLRWTVDDQLVVGIGNAARVQLPAGTTARLRVAAERARSAVGDKVFWGRPGCDKEAFVFPRDGSDAGGPMQLIVAKGEEPIENLRPAVLTDFGRVMLESIPRDPELMDDDPRTRDLYRRVREAFRWIGGSVN